MIAYRIKVSQFIAGKWVKLLSMKADSLEDANEAVQGGYRSLASVSSDSMWKLETNEDAKRVICVPLGLGPVKVEVVGTLS